MNATHKLMLLAAVAASNSVAVAGLGSNRGAASGDAGIFRDIYAHSVFDTNRYRASTVIIEPPKAQLRTDSLTLTGTVISDRDGVAFFEGTLPGCEGEFQARQHLGDLRIVSVEFDHVTLQAGGRTFHLGAGSRLSRREGGAWTLVSRYDAGPSARVVADLAEPSGPMSDVEKRLMEKRAAELK